MWSLPPWRQPCWLLFPAVAIWPWVWRPLVRLLQSISNWGSRGKVAMLADGNGNFAKAVGLEMDGSGLGLGTRGQRFSMIVNDGVVEELHGEAPGDYKVSSAEIGRANV